ncbi:MAG: phosphoenolpyruvate carboxykinase [Hyphomicrobium sp.]|nr:phosphoenolpyruvate carboxykinase [Hyphomicrobium sp.]
MSSEIFPLNACRKLSINNTVPELVEIAVRRNEGRLAASGAFVVETGQHTGRSVADKFIVRDADTEGAIWWDNNKSMSEEQFERLLQDFLSFAKLKELYVQDLFAGADAGSRLPTRVFCEYAWHALFIRHLLRRPDMGDLENFTPGLTIVALPSFRAAPDYHGTRSETVIACNFTRRIVLIGGTSYAGEIKKSVFSYLNYRLPQKGVMPMHCSANVGAQGDSAVFFGLSGTGKTTLSADPKRTLIGDDEHGWSPRGIFNFEGGCYAKTIRLSKEAEPEIHAAASRFATVLENVIVNPITGAADFDDGRLTENTRAAYPLEAIPNASATGVAGHPKNIVMLTADAFGVMPPIAKLSAAQAVYHFLSGYTAKVAGTEKGMGSEPQATFSTCFGAPFMPRHPAEYGSLLRRLIAEHGVDCWLVNTGWTGGKFGTGTRMPIKLTRALLNAALSGELKSLPMRTDPVFGFDVPVAVPGLDGKVLDPRATWADPALYDETARKLVGMFEANFGKYESQVDAEVRNARPGAVNKAAA